MIRDEIKIHSEEGEVFDKKKQLQGKYEPWNC